MSPTTELTGTIMNGRVELDAPADLPDGTPVRVSVAAPVVEAEDDGPPPEPYDRERELALLRESLADVAAGRVRPFQEVMEEIRLRYNLPDVEEPG